MDVGPYEPFNPENTENTLSWQTPEVFLIVRERSQLFHTQQLQQIDSSNHKRLSSPERVPYGPMGNATQPCRAIQDTETVEAVEAVEAADGATSCGLCVHEYLFPMYVVKAGAMGPLGHWQSEES